MRSRSAAPSEIDQRHGLITDQRPPLLVGIDEVASQVRDHPAIRYRPSLGRTQADHPSGSLRQSAVYIRPDVGLAELIRCQEEVQLVHPERPDVFAVAHPAKPKIDDVLRPMPKCLEHESQRLWNMLIKQKPCYATASWN